MKTLILHVNEDNYFVPFLGELLVYHFIEIHLHPIHDESSAGDKDYEAVIAVLSKNALKSTKIEQFLDVFKTQNTKAKKVLLLLDPIDKSQLKLKSKDIVMIELYSDMLAGFQKLFHVLGKEFLPQLERRTISERRTLDDQRKFDDRRKSDLKQRMRTGFWKAYSVSTGISEFAEFLLGYHQLFIIKEALKNEAQKYRYLDKNGNDTPVEDVLDNSINAVWETLAGKEYAEAASIIDSMIDEIFNRYEVEFIDQRTKPDRRKGENRRKDNPSGVN